MTEHPMTCNETMPGDSAGDGPPPRLSVIVPVKNEAENLLPLIAEIEAACAEIDGFEIVYVA